MEIIAALIKNCTFHPDILIQQGLYIYEVFDGQKSYNVICNAPNVKIGMVSVFAPAGSTTPKGLKVKDIIFKGTKSEGVLCSPKDLDYFPNEEDIIDLPPNFPLGTKLKEIPLDLLTSTPWYLYKLIDTIWENKHTKKLLVTRSDEQSPSAELYRPISQTYYKNEKYFYRSFIH
jgi:tRNA-binding EMAP/Myf-like protein